MIRRVLLLVLVLGACDSKPSAPAATSAASSANPNAADDLGPAIEVKPQKAPKFSLSKLDEKALGSLVAHAGFNVTLQGHTPSGAGESATKVGGFKKDGDGNLECTVLVRCGSKDASHDAGTAYFVDGDCQITAEVRRGIRKKSAESQRLLEQILGG